MSNPVDMLRLSLLILAVALAACSLTAPPNQADPYADLEPAEVMALTDAYVLEEALSTQAQGAARLYARASYSSRFDLEPLGRGIPLITFWDTKDYIVMKMWDANSRSVKCRVFREGKKFTVYNPRDRKSRTFRQDSGPIRRYDQHCFDKDGDWTSAKAFRVKVP